MTYEEKQEKLEAVETIKRCAHEIECIANDFVLEKYEDKTFSEIVSNSTNVWCYANRVLRKLEKEEVSD